MLSESFLCICVHIHGRAPLSLSQENFLLQCSGFYRDLFLFTRLRISGCACTPRCCRESTSPPVQLRKQHRRKPGKNLRAGGCGGLLWKERLGIRHGDYTQELLAANVINTKLPPGQEYKIPAWKRKTILDA